MSRSIRRWVRRSVSSMSFASVQEEQPYITAGATVPLNSRSLLRREHRLLVSSSRNLRKQRQPDAILLGNSTR
eukprot:3674729-Pyramimonas_sp.AAC.1